MTPYSNANYSGTDSFTFKVNDTLLDSPPAQVDINVGPVNDSPAADAQSVTAVEDTSLTITLAGSDSEVSTLTFAVVTSPTNGTLGTITPLTATSAQVTYTPNANYSGTDSFTFKVNDTLLDSLPAQVDINVGPVNDIPAAEDDAWDIVQDTSIPITVLSNDYDIDGAIDSTSVTNFSNPLSGNASVNADGSVTYTPNTGFYGIDSFSYTVRDNIGAASNEATVTVIVNKRRPSRLEIELMIKAFKENPTQANEAEVTNMIEEYME